MAEVKSIIVDSGPDLLEPFLDEISTNLLKDIFGEVMPELIKDLPLLKYGKTAGDIYSAYRTLMLRRRMRAFLNALIDEKFSIDDFRELPQSEQQMVIDILVAELDGQTDDKQAEALALLFAAYIRKDIDRLIFHGVAHELKNINPLTFYFNVDNLTTGESKAGIRLTGGPTHYLPSTFYGNRSDTLNFSSDLFLTNLGKIFFTCIYNPMMQKYLI